MPYSFASQREQLFNEEGQVLFLKVRDRVKGLLEQAKAFRMDSLIQHSWGMAADDWSVLACVDRMVELGEVVEVKYGECAGQHRVFMANRHA